MWRSRADTWELTELVDPAHECGPIQLDPAGARDSQSDAAIHLDAGVVEVLLVEDVSDHAELALRAFARAGRPFEVTVVRDLAGAREHLARRDAHVVIADLFLPDGEGTSLLPRVPPRFPLVILTSQGDEQRAVSAIKAGAVDYVVKSPFTLADLPRIAARALREWHHRAKHHTRRQRYEAILAATSDLIAQIDASGRCVWFNAAARAFFGERAAGDIERQLDRATREALLRGVEDEAYGERLTRSADGTRRLLGWWYRAMRDHNNHTVALLCTARDLTEARAMERDLQHAQKIEALGRLSASIAHDFNNVLMGIVGMADLALTEVSAGGRAAGEIRELKRHALSAASLTQQLLSFARSPPTDVSVVDLDQVVEHLEPMILPLLGPHIRLGVVKSSGGATIAADRGQIEQLLVNLLVNASDAMPDGGDITVTIATEARQVLLAVDDTGVGMDDATLSRLFDPYFTTKGEGRGTGLGLATAYGIVKRHGGEIRALSEFGRGTSFVIRFARAAGESTRTPPKLLAPPPRVDEAATVLVVEDDAPSRRALTLLLAGHGYAVLDAATCGEALERCRDHEAPIDLLIADLKLPDGSGATLADEARPVCGLRGSILISGLPHTDELPPDTVFLLKPVDFAVLERHARNLLARAPGDRA